MQEVVVGSIARLGGSSGGGDDGEHASAGVELGRYLKALEHELSRQRTARERVEHEAATLSGRQPALLASNEPATAASS